MPKVLVVDDYCDVVTLLVDVFESWGWRASVALSAETARSVVSAGSVDLAVVDLLMPGEDGLDLALHLRQTDIPVLMMTGSTWRLSEIATAGFPVLAKPFRIETLRSAVGSLIGGQSAHPANRLLPGTSGRRRPLARRRSRVVVPFRATLPSQLR